MLPPPSQPSHPGPGTPTDRDYGDPEGNRKCYLGGLDFSVGVTGPRHLALEQQILDKSPYLCTQLDGGPERTPMESARGGGYWARGGEYPADAKSPAAQLLSRGHCSSKPMKVRGA